MGTAATMNTDVKKEIDAATEKIIGDANLKVQFEQNPKRVVTDILHRELPEAMLEHVINAVRVNVSIKSLSQLSGSLKDLL